MDDQLAAALEHWAPRMTGNGILPPDLARVAAGIDVWHEWCGAWIDVAAQHEALGRTALAEGRRRSAGEHLRRAAVSYHFGRFVYFEDLELAGQAAQGAVRCLTDALPYLDPPGRRFAVPFEDAQIVGVMRTPRTPAPVPALVPQPLVILIPGLDSTKEELSIVEDTFLCRGMATLSVDGPGQGETADHLPIRPDYEAVGVALVKALEDDPAIDSTRIAVWGISLGGYYAARVAAVVPGIRACASLSGPFEMRDVVQNGPALTREAFRRKSGAVDDADAMSRAAQLTLRDHAREITCPLLVLSGGRDRIAPPSHQARLAEEGAAEEFLFFEDGNHGCTNLLDHHRPFVADWLARKLAVEPRRPAGESPSYYA